MGASAGETRQDFEREVLPQLGVMYGLALRLTGGDAAHSEDLVQESILEAWRARDGQEGGANARARLLGILRDAFLDELRRTGPRGDRAGSDAVADRPDRPALFEADPEGRVLDLIDGDAIARAIEELPSELRVPVVLADLEGLGYHEISDELGIPVGAVKARISGGRRRLQDRLHRHLVEGGHLP